MIDFERTRCGFIWIVTVPKTHVCGQLIWRTYPTLEVWVSLWAVISRKCIFLTFFAETEYSGPYLFCTSMYRNLLPHSDDGQENTWLQQDNTTVQTYDGEPWGHTWNACSLEESFCRGCGLPDHQIFLYLTLSYGIILSPLLTWRILTPAAKHPSLCGKDFSGHTPVDAPQHDSTCSPVWSCG